MGLFDRLQSEIEAREKAEGLTMADVLALPDEQSKLLTWLINQKEASLYEIVNHLNVPEPEVRSMMDSLVEESFVREMPVAGVVRYKVRFARRRGRDLPLNIWQTLDEKLPSDKLTGDKHRDQSEE